MPVSAALAKLSAWCGPAGTLRSNRRVGPGGSYTSVSIMAASGVAGDASARWQAVAHRAPARRSADQGPAVIEELDHGGLETAATRRRRLGELRPSDLDRQPQAAVGVGDAQLDRSRLVDRLLRADEPGAALVSDQ